METVNFTRIKKISNSRDFRKIRRSCLALLKIYSGFFSALRIFTVFINFIEEFNPGHFLASPGCSSYSY